MRAKQLAIIQVTGGAGMDTTVRQLLGGLSSLGSEHRLPLVQLCIPPLRLVSKEGLDKFFGLLDELVYADDSVSPFEFALQKMLLRGLEIGKSPSSAIIQFYSFNAVVPDISVVLSGAHASAQDGADARQSFDAAADQLRQITTELRFLPAENSSLEKLDKSLDRLAVASLPIKQRTLFAAAYACATDGKVGKAEGELLRAIAAALDVPIPA